MKKILKHLRKNWIRHGFETLVVVVGVLIAFTLNNWNENRKDSKYKKQLVNNLIVELYTAKSNLSSSIEHATKVVEYGNVFLKIAGENNQSVPIDSIKTLAGWTNAKILFKLNLPTYEEGQSSGRLSLIDNPDVLRGYSEIFVALEDYNHHFPIGGQMYYTEQVRNFREKYGSLGVLNRTSDEVAPQFRISDKEYRKMIIEPNVYGMMESGNILSWNILNSLKDMDESVTEVITMLEEM